MPRAAPDRGKAAAWRYAALAVGGLGGALFVLDGWELQLTATARESRLLAAVKPRTAMGGTGLWGSGFRSYCPLPRLRVCCGRSAWLHATKA